MVRTLAALADEVGSIPSTHVGWPQPPGTLGRRSPKFFWPPHPHARYSHRHTQNFFFLI